MNKNILILGAKSDIAQACAYLFAEKSYSLSLGARKSEDLEALKKDIGIKHNVAVDTYTFDALAFDTHQSFFDNLKQKPHIVLCVFGYLGDNDIAKTSFSEAKKIIDVNFTGAVSILNVVANAFEQQQDGTIIGISSVAADRGRQSNYHYGAAKAGFSAYLSGLRNRLFHSKVHVATIQPGFVDTQMTFGLDLPKPITAQPQQVAKAIYKASHKKQNIVYSLWVWRWIMCIIKNIPEFIFKRLKM